MKNLKITKFDLPNITCKTSEIDFLKEYIIVLEPTVSSLYQLQRDEKYLYDMLLPKLFPLRY